jgi:transposase
MIAAGADLKIYVAMRPVDFRRGHDGLAAMVQQTFGLDPFLCVGRDYVAELRRCPPSLPSLESSAT